MKFKDYYKILELETSRVTIDQIKAAYRKQAKKYHPDVNVGNKIAEERIKDVEEFVQNRKFNVVSNIQFGEGGAGTFSDGKLTTRIKDIRCRKVLEELVNFGSPDEILYSPLLRAADTAKHISEMTGIPAHMEPRLIEQNFGVWEGTSPRNAPEFLEAKKDFLNRYGNGESMFELAQRIYNLLDELKEQQDKTCILVAHNGIARVVQSYFKDMTNEEYAAFGVQNCSVTEFSFKEK